MDGCAEWKEPCEKPVFSEEDGLKAKDCVWRCPKPGAEDIESPFCMPSMCGDSARLSREYAERVAVVNIEICPVANDRTKKGLVRYRS